MKQSIDRPSNLRRNIWRGIAGTVAAGALIGGGVILQKRDDRNRAHEDAAYNAHIAEVNAAFQADGFALDTKEPLVRVHFIASKAVLELSDCKISDVSYKTVKDDAGKIIDTNSYEFSGIAYPRYGTKTVVRGMQHEQVETVEGSTVTFQFNNLAELQHDLGDNPCATLANNITRENSGQ